MCFSNLPLEFDEAGNPYLAEEAEAVDRPGEHGSTHDHAGDCGCEADGSGSDLERDPEEAYESIVQSLPAAARAHVEGEVSEVTGDDPAARPETDPESVGGD